MRLFFSSRVIHASLSVMLCIMLLKIFPLAEQTIAVGYLPKSVNYDMSASVCIGVIFMCVLLITGDNLIIKKSDLS